MDFKVSKRPAADDLSLSIEDRQMLNFKLWFQGSKVVDDIGHPLVVYHGSDQRIQHFDANKSSDGVWFSECEMDAGDYGHEIHEAYLAIKNPAYFKRVDGDLGIKAAITKAKAKGHDGLIVTSPTFEEGGDASGATWRTNFVAFRDDQIRHADSIATPAPAR